ncbi:MAG: MBOAT family protein [Bdellovibrionales bacterium]|nr:MBOAT family protein [Bdellovibrionales bacterium]
MLFNSFEYLIFLPLVFILYYLLPHRFRALLLLIASYYFYMSWKAEYIILILASTFIDFFIGQRIPLAPSKQAKKRLLAISLIGNLGLLFTFKYLDFFLQSSSELLSLMGLSVNFPKASLILPVGISFYTFQTLSYTIDVYRGLLTPTSNLLRFALYVSFFPQLVAGPIERPSHLLYQFEQKALFNWKETISGLKLILWGLFKKVVIADRLAAFVDVIYDTPDQHSGTYLLVGTLFFSFQIMCDFSGYSDIAIGSARLLGIDLMKNFNRPYAARCFTDFWRRWHISLSTWFRDYVYIPLGGNRASYLIHLRNLFLTFLISGLWHGANYTFVIWGALHGAFIVLEVTTRTARTAFREALEKILPLFVWSCLSWALVFTLTNLTWIFFRANTASDAWIVLTRCMSDVSLLSFDPTQIGLTWLDFVLCCIGIFILEVVQFFERDRLKGDLFATYPLILRWSVLSLLLFAVAFFGVFDYSEFIYFQF